MAVNSRNPILDLMTRADALAQRFDETHRHTLPVVDQLSAAIQQSGTTDDARAETCLAHLRAALEHMEQSVQEMMGMLYNVDVFLAEPMQAGVSSKDPRAALEHISDSFHVSATADGAARGTRA